MNKKLLLIPLAMLALLSIAYAATGNLGIDWANPAASEVVENGVATNVTLNVTAKLGSTATGEANITNVTFQYKCFLETSWTTIAVISNYTPQQIYMNSTGASGTTGGWNSSKVLDTSCKLRAFAVNFSNATAFSAERTVTVNNTVPTLSYGSSSPANDATTKVLTDVYTLEATEPLGSAFIYFGNIRSPMTASNSSNMSYTYTVDNSVAEGTYQVHMIAADNAGGTAESFRTSSRTFTVDRTGNKLPRAGIAQSVLGGDPQKQAALLVVLIGAGFLFLKRKK